MLEISIGILASLLSAVLSQFAARIYSRLSKDFATNVNENITAGRDIVSDDKQSPVIDASDIKGSDSLDSTITDSLPDELGADYILDVEIARLLAKAEAAAVAAAEADSPWGSERPRLKAAAAPVAAAAAAIPPVRHPAAAAPQVYSAKSSAKWIFILLIGLLGLLVASVFIWPEILTRVKEFGSWLHNILSKPIIYIPLVILALSTILGFLFGGRNLARIVSIVFAFNVSVFLIWLSFSLVKSASAAPNAEYIGIIAQNILGAFISVTVSIHILFYCFGGVVASLFPKKLWPKVIDYPYYLAAAALLIMIAYNIQSSQGDLIRIAGYEIVVGILVLNLKILKTSVELFTCFGHPTELIRTLPPKGVVLFERELEPDT